MSTRARWAPTALDLGSVGAGGRCWRRVLRVDARALSNSLVYPWYKAWYGNCLAAAARWSG